MQDAICARPAGFVCSLFILSAVFSSVAVVPGENVGITYALFALCAILAVAFIVILVFASLTAARNERKQTFFLRVIACAMLFSAIGIALSGYFYGIRPKNIVSEYSGEKTKIFFTAEACSYYSSYKAIYQVRITELDGEKVSIPATLVCEDERDLSVGDSAYTTGSISAAELPDDTLLSRFYYASEGRFIVVDAGKAPFTDRSESEDISAKLARLRTSLSADINVRLGRDEGGLVSALMLGDRTDLSDRVSSDFRILGISHIIAISGMHLSLMIIAVDMLLRRMRAPAVFRGIFVVVLAVFYAALTGFSASVTRAVVMLLIAKAAPLFGRRGDPVTSLCITVFVMMLFSPSAMTDVGLLLSFAATFGIVTLGACWQKGLDKMCSGLEERFRGESKDDEDIEDIEERLRGETDKDKNKLKQSLSDKIACIFVGMFSYFASIVLMSIAATLFTLPLVMALFGSMSMLFLPANLIFVPLSTVLLIASPFVLFFGIPFIPAPISSLAYGIVADLSRAVMSLSSSMASQSTDMMIMNPLEVAATTAVSLVVFLLLRRLLLKSSRVYRIGPRRARRITVAATALATLLAFISSSLIYENLWYKSTSISYFTSGSDECILLRDGRDDVLIDISDGSRSVVKAAARMAENGAPDTIVLTHVRDLHVMIYKTLIVQMYPERLYIPTPTDDDERYLSDRIVALAEASNTEIIFYLPGEVLTFSNYTFTVTEYTVPEGKTHPVICFDLAPLGEGESLSYIGGDFRSCAGKPGRVTYPCLTAPEHLIIGGHDPTAKTSIEYYVRSTKTVLYGSEKAYEYNKNSGGPVTQRIQVYVKDRIGEYEIELRKDN